MKQKDREKAKLKGTNHQNHIQNFENFVCIDVNYKVD